MDAVFGGNSLGLLGDVRVFALQPDGKVIVGGTFGGGIVRLDTDGSFDPGFQAGYDGNGNITLLALQSDGKIIVSGNSGRTDNLKETNVARLNADGSLDTSFEAPTGAIIRAVAVQTDGKVLVIGYFTTPALNATLVRLNVDGSVDTTFQAGTNGEVGISETGLSTCVVAIQTDGEILVYSGFYNADDDLDAKLVRLDTDGSLDTGFVPDGIANFLTAMAVQSDGKIIISGELTPGGGSPVPGIARLNTNGSQDGSFAVTSCEAAALAVQPNGQIVACGSVVGASGNGTTALTRFNADGSVDASLQTAANATPSALALQPDGKIIIGGVFSVVNGMGTSSVVRLTADGALDDYFDADAASGPNRAVAALAVQPDGKVIIGGGFTQVNGISHLSLARLNANGTPDAAFLANVSGSVNALALQSDGKILVGGVFNQVNGISGNNLARINTDGSLDSAFKGSTNSYASVNALAVQPDGKIVVGGDFTQIAGVSQSNLARLNTDGSLDTSFQPPAKPATVLALQPDGKILVSTSFFNNASGSYSYGQLFRLNADGSADASFQPPADDTAFALALQADGKIIVGGRLNSATGVSQALLARLNADGSADASFQATMAGGTNTNAGPYAVAVQPDGEIVAGGSFSQVNGANCNNLVRLNADGSLDPFFNGGSSGMNGTVNVVALKTSGDIFTGGNFTTYNQALRNYIAALIGAATPDFFDGAVPVGGGFYYLQFPDGNPFGYYNVAGNGYSFPFFFHADLGFEYFLDAQDGQGGAYLYDFKSNTFFYTSPVFPFPYLYDFSLNAFLYYYPDPNNPGHYNTDGVRYFYNFNTQQIISK